MGFLFQISLLIPLLAVGVLYLRPDFVLQPHQSEQLTKVVEDLKSQAFGWIHQKRPTNELAREEEKPNNTPLKMKGCLKDGERLWTVEELSAYDGSDQSKGVYLAFLGKVYDVDKGRKHYGPGGSYSIFAAKDASRAYLSGDFSDAELVENIFGLPIESYTAVREWDEFYQSEYDMVGKLQGLFYDSNGCATDQLNEAWALVDQASSSVQEEDDDEKLFPPCNSQWDQNEQRTRLWCSDMSGGAKRDWVGKPRRLYMPKHNVHRCACVKDTGLASTSSVQYADTDHSELKTDNANQGDLNNARVSLFPACDPTAIECIVTEDQLNAK